MNLESAIVLDDGKACSYFKGTRSRQAVVAAMKRLKCRGYVLTKKTNMAGYYIEILQRPWDGSLVEGEQLCILDEAISKN